MKKLNKIVRNENGSITMFVILSVLFLIFVLVGIYANYTNKLKAQENRIEKIQGNYGEYASDEGIDKLYLALTRPEVEEDLTILPIGDGTTPWLPTGFTKVKGTSLDTGLTIANTDNGTAGTQNYVWVEVPNNVKQTITVNSTETEMSLVEATSNNEIELILKAYAGDYTKGSSTTKTNEWKDEWYSSCGMTNAEYQNAYGSMLKSVQKYGGFWLAQYEAGIAYDKGNRTSNSEITVTKANYAKDQYAYNWVTCSQAQGIANADSVEGKYTSSLPFGIQWDLVCRFLEEKGTKTYDEIATNSAWGNYDNILWTSSANSKYSADGVTFNASAYTKTAVENILLTTGAIATINSYVNTSGEETTISTTVNPMNIYDLAGNASEWTLENSALSDTPSVRRGGNFYNSYKEYQFAHKLAKETTDVEVYTGFRSTLYTEEDTDVETLPSEYQELEYIESTGTQYIDTGMKLNQDSKTELEIEITEAGNYNVFGSRSSATENNIGIIFSNTYNEIDVDFQDYTKNRLKTSYDISKKIYSISNEALSAGDTSKSVTSYSDFTTPENAYIFSMSGNSPTYDNAKMKLYYCKIWDKGALVRNFVPCYRKSDNVAGMYDLVKREFYTNKGTGRFLKGPHADGTTEIEYIQSTGTQYIDTGVIPTSTTGFVLDLTILDEINASGKRLFGSSYRNNGNWGGIMLATYNQFEGGQLGYGTTESFVNPQLVSNDRMQISFINKHYTSSTGADIYFADTTLQPYGSIYILNINTDVSASTYSSAILYSAQIYDGETVIRDYIPVLDKEGVACLYDKVEGKYYYNKGTGNFKIADDNELLPAEYQQVEYIEKDVGYSSLGQYINTGVTVTKSNYNKIRFIVDEVLTETATAGWYLNGAASNGRNAIYVGIAKNTFYYGVGNDTSTGVAPSSNETRYVYDLDIKNDKYTITDYVKGEVVVNKSSIAKNESNFTDAGLPLYLMAYSGENRGHKSKLYGAKIYMDDELIREYVPCIRKDDNIIGLYDKINDEFYTNPGTGSFTAGGNIE